MSGPLDRREMLRGLGLGAAAFAATHALAPSDANGASVGGKPHQAKVHPMTAANLRSAFGGESMARMRYTLWGDQAEADGFPNTARLFQAIAHAERVHATNHFNVLGVEAGPHLVAAMGEFGVGTTSENLGHAIAGELYEVNEMYPVFAQGALIQSEREAVQSFRYALEAEKSHAGLFQGAKRAVGGKKDMELGPVRVCGECGYTLAGKIPAACPICAAKPERFASFE